MATSRRLELADVFRGHGDRLEGLTSQQKRAVRSITSCRTAALGGHVQTCDTCGHSEMRYNSCRDRHCPKCGGLDKARWVEARQEDVLPVEYHHVVFTIPQELHALFLANPRVAYGLLFGAAAETLLQVAANPKNLGARIGFTAVLHTWTQTLLYHPHVHCIVPGGGPSPAGDRWVSAKSGFFLPVKILSLVFRGKLLSMLQKAHTDGAVRGPEGHDVAALLVAAACKSWVVYSKPPVAGAHQVIDYLSRYTHRIAISNDRLVAMTDDRVTFRWKDRAHGNQEKVMTLGAPEFMKRFLLHVLPRGMVRIRHYGFLCNAVRRREIQRCRALLADPHREAQLSPEGRSETWQHLLLRLTGRDVTRCPRCRTGRMTETGEILPTSSPAQLPTRDVAS
ncbi:MAG: IS91 family transposase [Candidatus Methylomirabilis sp.]